MIEFNLKDIKVWDIVYDRYGKFLKILYINETKICLYFYVNKTTMFLHKEVLKHKKYRYIDRRPWRQKLLWIK